MLNDMKLKRSRSRSIDRNLKRTKSKKLTANCNIEEEFSNEECDEDSGNNRE